MNEKDEVTDDKVKEQDEATTDEANESEKKLGKFAMLKKLIQDAIDSGATPEQIQELKSLVSSESNSHPTKKRLTKDQRKAKQKVEKKARKLNRDTTRGYKQNKGRRFTLQ